jgi:quinol monooxygenase YgiN
MIGDRMTDLLTVVAEMKAKPGREADLRNALLALIEPTRQEDGCVQYDLHVHTADPGRFVFYENWASEEHLRRHAASPHLTAFVEVTGDLLAGPMRVETYRRLP